MDSKTDQFDNIEAPQTPYSRATEFSPIVRIYHKIKRNDFCPYSGKKFKKCCGISGQDFCEKARESLKNFLNKNGQSSS